MEPTENEVVKITKEEYREYKESVARRDALIALSKNKHFKLFRKTFVEDSLVQLGLNLGVQPQMRDELHRQIEARRIFNEFCRQVIDMGNDAEEVINGTEVE